MHTQHGLRHNTAALWRASELREEAEEDAVEEEDGEAEVALGVGERVEGGAEGGGGVGAEEEWREERFTRASKVSVYGH